MKEVTIRTYQSNNVNSEGSTQPRKPGEFADFRSCELTRQSLVSDILVGMNLKSQNRSSALDFLDKRSNATE